MTMRDEEDESQMRLWSDGPPEQGRREYRERKMQEYVHAPVPAAGCGSK
jgi:hypothetical protein